MTALHAAAYAEVDPRSLVIIGVVSALSMVVGALGYGLCLGASKDRPTPPPSATDERALEALARVEADRSLAYVEHVNDALALANGDGDFEHAVLVDLAHIDELADDTAGGER